MRVCSLIMVLALAAGAQELRRLDFEGQIPGEAPRSWRHAWGKMNDDLLLITNLQAASGKKSLLLDRVTGTSSESEEKAGPC
jgi:hypothetical protein